MVEPLWLSVVLIGLPMVVWPYRIARFQERQQSLGSKRAWHEVEPMEVTVELTRVFGVGIVLIGFLFFLLD